MSSPTSKSQYDDSGSGSLPSAGLFTYQDETARSQWESCLDNLSQMLALRDNWDGEGALVPIRDTVLSLSDLLQQLQSCLWPPPARVVVGPNGEVVVEWQQAGGYLELEALRPYEGEWMFERKGAPRVFFPAAWPDTRELLRPQTSYLWQAYP
ncbi:MAG: hypothetical protein ACRED0_03810 [Gammaproteobacteria bacterium]